MRKNYQRPILSSLFMTAILVGVFALLYFGVEASEHAGPKARLIRDTYYGGILMFSICFSALWFLMLINIRSLKSLLPH